MEVVLFIVFFCIASLVSAFIYGHFKGKSAIWNAALAVTLSAGMIAAHGTLASVLIKSYERGNAEYEAAMALQKTRQRAEDILAHAVTLRFDKTCTFNGYVVEGEWLRNDLQPCIERGNIRIWRVEDSTRNGTYVRYELGRVNEDGTVSSGFSYNGNGLFPYPYRSDDDMIENVAKLLESAFPLPAKASL